MRISDWSSDVCSSDLTTTKYVTLGGFVHLSFDDKGNITNTEHGAAVFGDATSYLQVPVKGTGHYDGDFLATMINQESTGNVPVFQWLVGSSSVDVDFAKSTADLALNGTVGQGYAGDAPVSDRSEERRVGKGGVRTLRTRGVG